MARTQLKGTQVEDGTVQRSDLDVVTPGQALIRKILAGTGVTISYTGADSGTGDVTINTTGGGGGGGTSGTIDVDFGTVPVTSKTFSATVAGVLTSSIIVVVPSPVAASGSTRTPDELEMDSFTCSAYCAVDGTLITQISAIAGPVVGLYRFNYKF